MRFLTYFYFVLTIYVVIFASISESAQPDVKGKIGQFTTKLMTPLVEATNVNGNNIYSVNIEATTGNIVSLNSNNITSNYGTIGGVQINSNIYSYISDGISVLKTNQLLNASYLADNTNNHGWHLNGAASADLTAWIGNNNLSVGAGALTTGASPLGDTVYNTFDGSTYLVSTNADYAAMTTNFTIDFWVYIPDMTPASNVVFISRGNGTNGFYISLSTAGVLGMYVGASTAQFTFDMSTLPIGWYHIGIVRDSSNTKTALILNGVVRKNDAVANAITAAGNLEIGSYNGGNNKVESGTRIWGVHIDSDTSYTVDQSLIAYSASSKKDCRVSGNGKVSVVGQKRTWLALSSTTDVNLTDSTTTISSTTLYAPENGYYIYEINTHVNLIDNDGTAQYAFLSIVSPLASFESRFGFSADANAELWYGPYNGRTPYPVYLAKGEEIHVSASCQAGDNSQIYRSAAAGWVYLISEE